MLLVAVVLGSKDLDNLSTTWMNIEACDNSIVADGKFIEWWLTCFVSGGFPGVFPSVRVNPKLMPFPM